MSKNLYKSKLLLSKDEKLTHKELIEYKIKTNKIINILIEENNLLKRKQDIINNLFHELNLKNINDFKKFINNKKINKS